MILHKEETFRDETTEDTGMIMIIVRPRFYLTSCTDSEKLLRLLRIDKSKEDIISPEKGNVI